MFELRKQASLFLKEKIKAARLALTDVTSAQLLTEEATNGNPCAPDTPSLTFISNSAFEVDDYCRITHILHNKLSKFDRKNWRASYNSLIVLEYLLTHGPESVAKDFQTHKSIIKDIANFQHIDQKGFDWGLAVRKKCERTVKLLENEGGFLKEERENCRRVKREIKGFGSFSNSGSDRSSSPMTAYRFGDEDSNLSDSEAEKSKLMKENTAPRIEQDWDSDEEEGNTHPFKDTDKHRSSVSLLLCIS